MIADVVLGLNIDTSEWIQELKSDNSKNIFVIDYDYYGEPVKIEEVLYISSIDAKFHLEKFDTITFYKSMYIFPGMSGEMSSIYRK